MQSIRLDPGVDRRLIGDELDLEIGSR